MINNGKDLRVTEKHRAELFQKCVLFFDQGRSQLSRAPTALRVPSALWAPKTLLYVCDRVKTCSKYYVGKKKLEPYCLPNILIL